MSGTPRQRTHHNIRTLRAVDPVEVASFNILPDVFEAPYLSKWGEGKMRSEFRERIVVATWCAGREAPPTDGWGYTRATTRAEEKSEDAKDRSRSNLSVNMQRWRLAISTGTRQVAKGRRRMGDDEVEAGKSGRRRQTNVTVEHLEALFGGRLGASPRPPRSPQVPGTFQGECCPEPAWSRRRRRCSPPLEPAATPAWQSQS